jgi:hypothetical protein
MKRIPAEYGRARRSAALPETQPGNEPDNETALRLSATLLVAGVLVSLVSGLFHADLASANDHAAAFAAYAGSSVWITVHLGQFVGMALLTAGLLVLWSGLGVRLGAAAWTARLGVAAATAALALYGALQAVDGVALKHAVDAWTAAAGPDRAMRFAVAEGIRWLEWGMRSYHGFLLGSALILFGVTVAATGRIPRVIGYLMGLSGLAYLAQGWVIGAEGFSPATTLPTLTGIVLMVAWTVWFLISAWRSKGRAGAAVGPGNPAGTPAGPP